jgi:hypothetical protein
MRGQRPHQGLASSPNETCTGKLERGVGAGESASSISVAPPEHASHDHLASSGVCAETKIGRGWQANDSGSPTFSGKYVEYPRFRKEWWAYRQTYHGHVRDELVCRSLKEKSLASSI